MFHCDSVSIHVCTELSDKLMTLKQLTVNDTQQVEPKRWRSSTVKDRSTLRPQSHL